MAFCIHSCQAHYICNIEFADVLSFIQDISVTDTARYSYKLQLAYTLLYDYLQPKICMKLHCTNYAV